MNKSQIPVVCLNQKIMPPQDRTKEKNNEDDSKLLLLGGLPLRLCIIERMRDTFDNSVSVGVPVDQTTANSKDRRIALDDQRDTVVQVRQVQLSGNRTLEGLESNQHFRLRPLAHGVIDLARQ